MFCNLSDDMITIVDDKFFSTSQGSSDLVSIRKHGHILGIFAQLNKVNLTNRLTYYKGVSVGKEHHMKIYKAIAVKATSKRIQCQS